MTDPCVKKLAKNCPLTYVNLSGCKYLSDASITELIAHNQLEHLNITRLPKVTAKTLEVLANSSSYPTMTYLNLYANSMIEDVGF